MIINRANLDTLFASYNAAFRAGLIGMQASSQYMLVAMTANSSTSEGVYPWLGKIPGMKKWVGERVVENLRQHGFAIRNEDYEDTISVDRNSIDDDQYGVYTPMFQALGEAVASHPDELVWPLLKAGFSTLCYDGQNFFDTDHPVLDADGDEASVANTDADSITGGARQNETPWFLLDLRGTMKPIVFQSRKRADNIVRMDREDDPNVFMRKEYIYGVDCRDNVGFGLWQKSYGSKRALTGEAYAAARAALLGLKGDYGRPLGIMPTHLVVPPALEEQGREILNAERNAAGATNVWRGTAELQVVPWLA